MGDQLVIEIEGMGKVIASRKEFKTGNKGYGAYGKVTDFKGQKTYQLSLNLVELE